MPRARLWEPMSWAYFPDLLVSVRWPGSRRWIRGRGLSSLWRVVKQRSVLPLRNRRPDPTPAQYRHGQYSMAASMCSMDPSVSFQAHRFRILQLSSHRPAMTLPGVKQRHFLLNGIVWAFVSKMGTERWPDSPAPAIFS